jgi:hypothetical protein
MKRGHQQKLITGDEYDIMASPKHQYTNKDSASIKRGMRRRDRHQSKKLIEGEIENDTRN